MSNRHKSHVDACFLFLLRPSPSFPYFSKKITRLFFYVENVPIENFESNNGRYAFLISNHFCHHSFLSLSLSGHFYLTFPSTFLFVNFCASQLFAPSVIDDIPLSIRLIITPRLLPLPRWYVT
jgi:hypothetical protein